MSLKFFAKKLLLDLDEGKLLKKLNLFRLGITFFKIFGNPRGYAFIVINPRKDFEACSVFIFIYLF